MITYIDKIRIESMDGHITLYINGKALIVGIARPYETTITYLYKPKHISPEKFCEIFDVFIKECLFEYSSIKYIVLDESIETNLDVKTLCLLGYEVRKAIK